MTGPFVIARPRSWEEAAAAQNDKRWKLPVIKAGGMDVLDHLKEGLIQPDVLVDVRHLSRSREERLSWSRNDDGQEIWRISATATLAEIAGLDAIVKHLPALAQACESAATPQVRNVATLAGNLLQRPRCWYYRNDQFACLKKGGDRCFAVEGENRYHAIFGDDPCHIVHPSNAAVALLIADAIVHLVGGSRESIALADLFVSPSRNMRSEHVLERGEVITGVTIASRPASGFYAVKEKQSFDWPLVMAAASMELSGSSIRAARIAVGAVAPVPMRLPAVEAALAGVDLADEHGLRAACSAAAEGARPMRDNAYKVKLLPVAVRRAVLRAAGRPYHA